MGSRTISPHPHPHPLSSLSLPCESRLPISFACLPACLPVCLLVGGGRLPVLSTLSQPLNGWPSQGALLPLSLTHKDSDARWTPDGREQTYPTPCNYVLCIRWLQPIRSFTPSLTSML